jgi:hypothetical protein
LLAYIGHPPSQTAHGDTHRISTQERTLDKEKTEKVRATIAEVIGFEPDEVQDADRFIIDYNISYGERKALLERLNADYGKDLEFTAFCALEDVASVLKAYAA